jgi:2'-5' RNA ligase
MKSGARRHRTNGKSQRRSRADRMGFAFAGDAPAATKDFSCLVSRRIVIAYWLIPTEPARSSFRSLINKLALRYNAPVFEPHVTVHVGANCRDVVDGVSAAARHCEPIVLQALEVSSSTEFIKTLFVQFALNRQLQRLNQSIRNAAQDSSDYQLNPHLSLLYKRMSIQERRALMHSIEMPFPEVTFDSLIAVRCVSPTQSRVDVEAWRAVAAKPLGSMGV